MFKMLFELENTLHCGKIPFFWDKRMNMIGSLNEYLMADMYRRIVNIRTKICRLLNENQMEKLQNYMCKYLGGELVF